MEWMECSDEMEPSEWGWKMEEDKLVSVLTDKISAPNALIQMIHCSLQVCNCLEGFNTVAAATAAAARCGLRRTPTGDQK